MENEEIKDLNGTENEEEQREASIDEEFGEAISAALEETHKEMEEKQERADEAARERAEMRGKKEAVHKAKEKPPRNYEADRIAASARRRIEQLRRENDEFARQMGYEDFRQMREMNQEMPVRKAAVNDSRADNEFIQRVNEQRFAEELRELNEHFPEANAWTPDDFFKLENSQEIIKLAGAGVPLYRAYAAYATDSIAQSRAAAARRAALSAQGKEHLRKLGGIGSAAGESIPQDVLEQYRLINPKATDAEILAHWRRRD